MKEFIVIFATIVLGIAIAGFVIGLEDTAETMNENVTTKLETQFAIE